MCVADGDLLHFLLSSCVFLQVCVHVCVRQRDRDGDRGRADREAEMGTEATAENGKAG